MTATDLPRATDVPPALVLLPGLLCDRALWLPQIAAFAPRLPILVGDLTRDDSVEAMARRVLDDAPPRFALAGLSMGGYVAQEIVHQAPGRVDRLALLDTNARADTEEQRRRRQGLLALAKSGKFKGVTPRLLPLLLHPDRLEEADLTGIVMAMAERVGRDAFQRQQTAILNRRDRRADLAAIACPTLVVCGRQDALTPPELAEEIAAGIPGAHLAIVEECGHLSTLERPAEVTRLMARWLGLPD